MEQKVDGQQESLVTLYMPGDSSFSVFSEEIGLPSVQDPDEQRLQEEKWAVTRRVYQYLAEGERRRTCLGNSDRGASHQADHAED